MTMPERKTDEPTFADLMQDMIVEEHLLKPGQKVWATIVAVTAEGIFLDVGEKTEGFLHRKELENEAGLVTVKEGDTIEAYFVTRDDDQRIFTTRIGEADMARTLLHEAWKNRVPIEGIVEREVKGGYSIQIAPGSNGFCPFSQMGLHRTETPDKYIGQRLTFLIMEYGEKGRNIILSNRSILKEKQREQQEHLKQTLREGMTVRGRITALRDFGAFVEIGGVNGLQPTSEISWERVKNIREVLSVGQELDLLIIRLDWQKNRITLSRKKTLADPWNKIETRYIEGKLYAGTVTGLTDFGAFVLLEPGVEGLIHISTFGKKVKHIGEFLSEGQSVDVQIEKVEKEKKRISLIPKGVGWEKEKAIKRKNARDKQEEETKKRNSTYRDEHTKQS
jgi:small subunit ribosomal protein S1